MMSQRGHERQVASAHGAGQGITAGPCLEKGAHSWAELSTPPAACRELCVCVCVL